MQNYYKIFFTVYFDYAQSRNKTITKFFKSDIDLGPSNFSKRVYDKNIFKFWNEHAINSSISDLNPDKEYDNKKASNKKIITHRIVNLRTLSEVFLK